MSSLVGLILGLAIIALLLRHFLTTPPGDLARQFRVAGGAALLALGVGLAFMRQYAWAVPVGMAGFMMLRRHAAMQTAGPSRHKSRVRSAGLEMTLDHESGEMDGRILAGRYEGRLLSELAFGDLMQVAADFQADSESLRLLESYLDRTHAGWREDADVHGAEGQGAAPGTGSMGTKEAYQILGLEEGASAAEVREAHRRLIKQVHPDRGGSAALAAKINEAKDRILGKHG